MRMYKIIHNLFKPKKCKWSHGFIVCPRCHALAFRKSNTPKWMRSGHCFRCGKYLSWDIEKED